MVSWRQVAKESDTLLKRTGIPRGLLNRLVTASGLGVGFTVLDVGCGDGELAAYLDALGIRCVGIDERAEKVMAARRNFADCEFHCASIHERIPTLETAFDVILVREASTFNGSLLARSSFEATSQLVSKLRPQGCLAYLTQTSVTDADATGHRSSCFSNHVQLLPGACESHIAMARSSGTRSRRSEHSLVLFRPNRSLLTPLEWMRAIENAIRSQTASCCPWGARANDSTAFGSAAA